MNGYLRVCTMSPKVAVGAPRQNAKNIIDTLSTLNKDNVKVVVLPRLALTSCELYDISFDENILKDVDAALFDILEATKDFDMVVVVTNPLKYNNSLFEVATVINKGRILGMVPRDGFLNDERIFTNAKDLDVILKKIFNDKTYFIPVNKNLVFVSDKNENIKFAINFADDKKYTYANIILNPHNIKETYDADKYYHMYKDKSKEENKAYVVASPSFSESTTTNVYYQRSMIYEDGELINKSVKITDEYVIGDIDIDKLSSAHRSLTNKDLYKNYDFNKEILFSIDNTHIDIESVLYRKLNTTPFILSNADPYNFSMHIINIQALGLLKRMYASKAESFVLGVSGGLDSTLSLLVIKKACDIGLISLHNVYAVLLPCFGSSTKSMEIAFSLCKALGIEPMTIDIKNSVEMHLRDIGHNIVNKNTTYENAQARERTQVLMDIANDKNGLVVGTSDLSEIALGFSTYNGDHMSMYNVNSSVPKTLIRYMLESIAEYNIKNNGNVILSNTLLSILDRPVSPELVNDTPDTISQKTEDILGPYKLIDFYLYYYLTYHFDKEKLFDLARRYFIYNEKEEEIYNEDLLVKTLDNLMSRFYRSQYKRNCSPDGPSIGYPDLNSKFNFIAPSDIEI